MLYIDIEQVEDAILITPYHGGHKISMGIEVSATPEGIEYARCWVDGYTQGVIDARNIIGVDNAPRVHRNLDRIAQEIANA